MKYIDLICFPGMMIMYSQSTRLNKPLGENTMKYSLVNQDSLHIQVQFPSCKETVLKSIHDEKKICFRIRRNKTRLRLCIVSGVHQIYVNHIIPGYKLDVKQGIYDSNAEVSFKILKNQGLSQLGFYLADVIRCCYSEYEIDNVEIQISGHSFSDKMDEIIVLEKILAKA